MISNEIILDLVKNHEGIILDDTVCDRRLITDILQNTEIDIILNNDGKKIIISNKKKNNNELTMINIDSKPSLVKTKEFLYNSIDFSPKIMVDSKGIVYEIPYSLSSVYNDDNFINDGYQYVVVRERDDRKIKLPNILII